MKTCRLCLAVNIEVTPLADIRITRFIRNILINNGFDQQIYIYNYVCNICKAYVVKSYKFIQRVLRAQKVLCQIIEEKNQVSLDILKKIDRKHLALDSDFTFEILFDIDINEEEVSNSTETINTEAKVQDNEDDVKTEVADTVEDRDDSDRNAKTAETLTVPCIISEAVEDSDDSDRNAKTADTLTVPCIISESVQMSTVQSGKLLPSDTEINTQKETEIEWENEVCINDTLQQENVLATDSLANIHTVPHIIADSTFDSYNEIATIINKNISSDSNNRNEVFLNENEQLCNVSREKLLSSDINIDVHEENQIEWEKEVCINDTLHKENVLDADPLANITVVPNIVANSVLESCNQKVAIINENIITLFDSKNKNEAITNLVSDDNASQQSGDVVKKHKLKKKKKKKVRNNFDTSLKSSNRTETVKIQTEPNALNEIEDDISSDSSNKETAVANQQKKLVDKNTQLESMIKTTNKKRNLRKKLKVVDYDCGESFESDSDKNVKKKKHDVDEDYKVESKEEPESDREYPSKCDHCDFEIPQRSEHYRHYLQYHTHEQYPYRKHAKRVVCKVCGVKCRNKYYYRSHMLTHGKKKVKCKLCLQKYYNRMHLLNHIKRVHTKQRLFCDYCNKQFKTKEEIRRHIRIHTGERPYKCHICGVGYAHKGNLGVHMRSIHKNCRTNVKTSKHSKTRNARRNKRVRSDTESDYSEVEIKRKKRAKT